MPTSAGQCPRVLHQRHLQAQVTTCIAQRAGKHADPRKSTRANAAGIAQSTTTKRTSSTPIALQTTAC
eukprot:884367-Pyramimonas_sp.AAC.1